MEGQPSLEDGGGGLPAFELGPKTGGAEEVAGAGAGDKVELGVSGGGGVVQEAKPDKRKDEAVVRFGSLWLSANGMLEKAEAGAGVAGANAGKAELAL